MAHTELDLRERRAIEDMLNAKMPVSKIAAEIGRHRSTVYREINRNYFNDEELPELNGYYGMVAHQKASERRSRRRKLIRLPHPPSTFIFSKTYGLAESSGSYRTAAPPCYAICYAACNAICNTFAFCFQRLRESVTVLQKKRGNECYYVNACLCSPIYTSYSIFL
jgi:hypothetical protein